MSIMELLKQVSRGPQMDSFLYFDASTGKIEWRRQTKTLWFEFQTSGGAEVQMGAWSGWEINADGEDAWIRGIIPDDFGSLISAEVIWYPQAATGNMRWDTLMDGAADGEAYNTEGGTEQVVTASPVADQITFSDVSTTFADLVAGDAFGFYVIRPGTGNTDGVFMGLKIVYEVSVE